MSASTKDIGISSPAASQVSVPATDLADRGDRIGDIFEEIEQLVRETDEWRKRAADLETRLERSTAAVKELEAEKRVAEERGMKLEKELSAARSLQKRSEEDALTSGRFAEHLLDENAAKYQDRLNAVTALHEQEHRRLRMAHADHVKRLQAQLTKVLQQNEKLSRARARLNSAKAKANTDHHEELERLLKRIADKTSENQAVRERNRALEMKLQNAENKRAELEGKLRVVEVSARQATARAATLEPIVAEKQSRVTQMAAMQKRVSEERDTIMARYAEAVAKIEAQQSALSRNSELERELAKTKSKCESLEAEVQRLRTRLPLKQLIEEKRAKIKALSAQRVSYPNSGVQDEISRTIANLSEECSELEDLLAASK